LGTGGETIGTGGDGGGNPAGPQNYHDVGVKRTHQIAEGDLKEFRILKKNEAFCQLNIEGKPEEYSKEWNAFFATLQERKGISISGWHFQIANPTIKKEMILGVFIQCTSK
jgi:hypothetical protein